MASPSVTYSFTNGTTADATQVNQNYTDILNGLSGGTWDVNFLSLVVGGTATFNGAVTLGNATGDDLTFTGLAASNFVPKTDSTYDLGSSTLGWNSLYLGENSTRVQLKASGSGSASYTFTYPVNAGVAGQVAVNQGSATMAWKYMTADTSAKSADYTVTDTDMIRTILMTTSNTDRTVTLPTAADNTGRIITVKKVDSGTGTVLIDGEGAETIDGQTGILLISQYEAATLHCDGTSWSVIGANITTKVSSIISSAQNAASTGNYLELASIALKQGTWRISAQAYCSGNGATFTASSNLDVAVSTTSASTSGSSVPESNAAASQQTLNSQPNSPMHIAMPDYSVTIAVSTSTTYYLNCRATYTGGTPQWRGALVARRISF